MAKVRWPDGRERAVKNLGWLLRHAREVRSLTLTEQPDGSAKLGALLGDSRSFVADFASAAVARQWIQRPSFTGARVLDARRYTIGGDA